ncbi:MAG: hypothetical protein JJT90_03075 [Ectothiorhodospiraceae bacterium]|nr:hypothetical protein [Ectothiorhodospiraceae bacterium]
MRIADYSVEMASQRLVFQQQRVTQRLETWQEPGAGESGTHREHIGAGTPPPLTPPPGPALGTGADELPGTGHTRGSEARDTSPAKRLAPADLERTPMDTLRMNLLRLLVEHFTGRRIQVYSPDEVIPEETPDVIQRPMPAEAPERDRARGWGVVFDHHVQRIEHESTRFQATGIVQTTDGQEIRIAIELGMSRTFMEETRISIRAGEQLRDPLVINFDGNAAELTETRFNFDLDADGREQQVAFLRPGSGFLAVDRSGSGRIDDGSELFGPRTGDGFAELRAYDEDGNNWIDAGDSIYDKLRIWTRDDQGNDRLLALGEVGIGAIYLGNAATPFELRDSDNNLQGRIQSTGLWVGENGRAGTVQHVDLAV